MAITNNDVLVISEPVEKMYTDCTSQLIINLAKHLGSDKELATAQWEIQKLSELDAITDESIQIIAINTGKAPAEIKKAITEGLAIETKAAEKTLQAAAAKGVIIGDATYTTWETSQGVKSVITNLSQQAVDDANIVNTVMLQSTRQRYVQAVQTAAAQEMVAIQKAQGFISGVPALDRQLAKTQTALNSATMSVAIGAEARTTAVRRVIKDLAAQGITGYIDKAGHHWSPEAYINMDIRTTVHNAAVQGQRARSADYGVTTFQMSSHAGARPLCAPYQGGLYSWDNTSGVVEDLYGNKHKYIGINKTSYGEPAGVFGINCGHFPQTFVSGFSLMRYGHTDDPADNARLYQLSQKQRYMERSIRQSKTEALAYKAAGDDEAYRAMVRKIAKQNAQYKEFCDTNGLTTRFGNAQVLGYSHAQVRQTIVSTPKKQSFWDEFGNYPKRPNKADFDDLDEYYKAREKYRRERDAYNNKFNEWVNTTYHDSYTYDEMVAWGKRNNVYCDPSLKEVDGRALKAYAERAEQLFQEFPQVQEYLARYDNLYQVSFNADALYGAEADNGIRFGGLFGDINDVAVRWYRNQLDGYLVHSADPILQIYDHEYGHMIEAVIRQDLDVHERVAFENDLVKSIYKKEGMSEYATTNANELFAEGFAAWHGGEQTEFAHAFGAFLKRYLK